MTTAQKFLCILFFSLLTQPTIAAKKNPVVATVGNEKITLNDFNIRYKEVKEKTINPPSKEVFLQDIVQYKMGVQEAKRLKLTNDPILKERVNQELYKILIERAIKDDVDKIRVKESEMKAWYKKNPNIRTSHILIELKPSSTPKQVKQVKTRALEVLRDIKKSKRPFNELVKLYTDDSLSRRTGGDIGFQNSQTLDPRYYNTARRMKKNQVKGLIKTRYGFHIIKMTDTQTYKESNKRLTRAYVFEEKKKKIFKKFFSTLRQRYPVKTFKNNL